MLRNMTGRDKSIQDYNEYIEKKHKSYINEFSIKEIKDAIILSETQRMTDTDILRRLIAHSIIEKVDKYEEYNSNFDSNMILVHFQGVGYSNEYDFYEVESMLKSELERRNNNMIIDRIFVSSGLNEVLVEYGNDGSYIKGTVDNGL